MKRKRAHINLKTKLVAALCALVHEEDGRLVPIIPHEHAKAMSEDQILSLFAWDHYPIPHAEDGPDEHWNIVPSLIPGHRIKTATIDTPGIAKRKRVARAHAEFVSRVLGPVKKPAEKRSQFARGRKIPSRPFKKVKP